MNKMYRNPKVLLNSGIPLQFFYLLSTIGDQAIVGKYNALRRAEAERYVQDFQSKSPIGANDLQNILDSVKSLRKDSSIFIYGPSGTGKTILASWILFRLITREQYPIRRAMFTNVSEWLDKMRPNRESDNADWLERAKEAQCLVLDDIGSETLSNWVFERLYTVVNYRRDSMLPTIYVSNLSLSDMENRLKEKDPVGAMRLVTRFMNTCQVWQVV